MTEYIYEETTDSDGVVCYIKRGEVVRCKDCKNASEALVNKCVYCDIFGGVVDEVGYCSYGERKDGDK